MTSRTTRARRAVHSAVLSTVLLCGAVFHGARPVLAQDRMNAPRELRVEAKQDPIGIDTEKPRFSWELDDPRRGAQQSAYQVMVSENPGLLASGTPDTWDSKVVPDHDTCQIEFAGRMLLPWRTYHWSVRTWDVDGKPSPWSALAKFTMGPLNAGDWRAAWIGPPTPKAAPQAASRIGYHSAYGTREDEFKYVQIDFGGMMVFDSMRIHPARPDGDTSKPGVLFPLQFKVYVDDNERFDHTFMKAGERTWKDVDDPGAEPFTLEFTRYKVRYIRLIVTKMQKEEGKGYAFALGEMEVLDGQNNVAPLGKVTVTDSLEEAGWGADALIDRVLVPRVGAGAPVVEAKPVTMLRKPFTLGSKPKRALLASTALGLYEVHLNGVRVGDHLLAPGWTDYKKRVPYQMYDVTELVRAGQNVVGALLAEGWYAGRVGLAHIVPNGPKRGIYGTNPRFRAQLQIDTDDGKTVVVTTDDTWRWTQGGAIRSSDLLDGETYDAHNEIRDWLAPTLPDPSWRPVEASTSDVALFAQVAEPVRARDAILARGVTEPQPGVFVYDFGQNVSGVVALEASDPGMPTWKLRHGEVLAEDGSLYTANLRSAAQTDRVGLRSTDAGWFMPTFTCHGFRYVEISGAKAALPLTSIAAVPMTSDVREVGSFECSDPMLDRLWKNIEWTRRNNMVGLPTDCPQRDERLGWMGDVLSFAHTGMFQADLQNFLSQWLTDVRNAQTEDGRFPDFAPHPYQPAERMSGAPGWGDAGVFVPWEMYLHYHDRRLLRASLDSMLRWVDFVHSKNPDLLWRRERANDYGDWLNGDSIALGSWISKGNEVPKDVFATMFFARSAELAAKAAFACGQKERDAERMNKLARDVKAAFRRAFVDEQGRIAGDTQAGYALAVDFGVFDGDPAGEARAVAHLVRKIEEAKGALTTGFHSTHRALLALSRHGRHDLAVQIARRREMPSFLYPIENGATTTWERWDGYVAGRGFQDPGMNSFDHFAFGSVGEWMMRSIGGIELDEAAYVSSGPVDLFPQPSGVTRTSAEGPRPFSHFVLRPESAGALTWAKVSHHSIAGTIGSAWRREGQTFTYDCTIPPNASATVWMPAKDLASVTEGGQPLSKARALQSPRMSGEHVVVDVPAGTYHFVSRLE